MDISFLRRSADVLRWLQDGNICCFCGPLQGLKSPGGQSNAGDLVAGFATESAVAENTQISLLRVPRELDNRLGTLLPLFSLAIRAVRLANPDRDETTVVTGHGALSNAIRIALEKTGVKKVSSTLPESGRESNLPTLAMETTGDPSVIVTLLKQLPRLARLALAAPVADRLIDIDFYSSVHKKGLVLIGVSELNLLKSDSGDVQIQEDIAAAVKILQSDRSDLLPLLSEISTANPFYGDYKALKEK